MFWWKARKSKIPPVYVLAFKRDKLPSEHEATLALGFLVQSGQVDPPTRDAKITRYCDAWMETTMVEESFFADVGRFLLQNVPELKDHITVNNDTFSSHGLQFKIAGYKSGAGFVRVIQVTGAR